MVESRKSVKKITSPILTVALTFVLVIPFFLSNVSGISTSFAVQGFITDSSGNPVVGAQIYFNEPNAATSAYTDWKGYYVVACLEGTYHVTILPPFDTNYLSYDDKTVFIGKSIAYMNFTLSSGFKVSGYVTDKAGTPVSGAPLFLNGTWTGWYSNASGYYFISALAGNYTISVRAPVYSNLVGYGENIVVTNDTVKNITLSEGLKISGYVTDSTGKGISGASVSFSSSIVTSMQSNAFGYYVAYAPAGKYSLYIVPPFDSNFLPYSDPNFVVNDSDIVMNFSLTSGCKVSGYIYDSARRPVADALVWFNGSGSGYHSTYSGYYYANVLPGTYTISMRLSPAISSQVYLEYYFEVSNDTYKNIFLDTPVPAPTPSPSPTPPIATPIPTQKPHPPGFKVSGYITDSLGRGLLGAMIQFINSTGRGVIPNVYTDSRGYYEFYAPADVYHMDIYPPYNSSYINDVEKGISLTDDISKNVTLGFGYKVSGFILDATGKPVSGMLVYLDDYYLSAYSSNAQGYYYVAAPPETYTLKVRGISITGSYTNVVYVEQNFVLAGDASKNVTLTYPPSTQTPAPPLTTPTPALTPMPTPTPTPLGTKVSGYVTDASGNGIAQARVIMYGLDGKSVAPSTYTGSSGYYETYVPAPTTLHLTVFPPYDSSYVNYEEYGLVINSATIRDIALVSGYKISGYLTDKAGNPVFNSMAFLDDRYLSGWGSTNQGYYYVSAPAGTHTFSVRGPPGSPGYPNEIYVEQNFVLTTNVSKNVTLTYP